MVETVGEEPIFSVFRCILLTFTGSLGGLIAGINGGVVAGANLYLSDIFPDITIQNK